MEEREELANLRRLLTMLESGDMRMGENGRDVTAREIEHLRTDIVCIERVLEQAKARRDAQGT